ncbi:MAG: MBL fold metallo-hydrolase [Comamonadaceae bacterium]|nr:MAG: MBL fold metallo-hydrolase [Comamonadaceae bacterium]
MTSPIDPSKPHHLAKGFRNTDGSSPQKSLAQVLRWRWQATRAGLPPRPATPTPVVTPDLDFLHRNASAGAAMRPTVTWIGHATVLAQLGGLNVLTDPVFAERASPFSFVGPKRHVAPGIALAALPRIDLVLVSHNHYDHLDDDAVRVLNRQAGGPPLFVVPLGLKDWLAARGITHAVELDWWDVHPMSTPAGRIHVMLVPAQHWSSRSLGDAMATLWGGFAVLAPDAHLFFAGDTAYSRDFVEIRRRLADRQSAEAGGGFDIALLPIGAYEPRWFMAAQHVNVAEALRIHADVGAKRSLGVHWGTFELTDEALDEPPRVLAGLRRAEGLCDDAFVVCAIGETLHIPPRPIRGTDRAPAAP